MHVNPHPRRSARTAILMAASLALLLLTQPVAAQDAAPKKAPAAKAAPKSKANLMTRDELRACMNETDRLQGMRAKFEQEQAELDRQKAQVQAMDAELQKDIAAFDGADEGARKKLEDKGNERDQAADRYNASLAGFRERGQTYNTAREQWAERCTKKDYDELDEAAIKKERQQAARAKK